MRCSGSQGRGVFFMRRLRKLKNPETTFFVVGPHRIRMLSESEMLKFFEQVDAHRSVKIHGKAATRVLCRSAVQHVMPDRLGRALSFKVPL